MKTRKLTALAVVALTASLAGCEGSPAPVVTVTAPSPGPTASPSVSPATTPTSGPAIVYTLDMTWDLSPADQAQGSGCAPGPGLPDGIWFGVVDSWSTTEIAFDMECWWTGAEAEAQAAARGEEAYDYFITNDAATIRVVSIADGAFGLKADNLSLSDPGAWVISTVAEVIADPGGSMPVAPDPLVWIAVNGGEVTSLAVQYVP